MINNKDEWFGKVSVDNHTEQSSKTEKKILAENSTLLTRDINIKCIPTY